MATSYSAPFDLARRDASGVLIPLPTETVNIEGLDPFAPTTSDESGFVPSAEIPTDADTLVEFSVTGYPNVLTQVVKETVDEAILANQLGVFLVEDLYETFAEAVQSDVYVQDLTSEGIKPKYVGSVVPGGALEIPFDAISAKDITVYLISRDDEGRQSDKNFSTAEHADFFAPANAPQGTVTSVALSLPGIFSVSGSPVTSAGTLAATLASQSQNLVLASPNGSSGAPSFRALFATDIPNLDTAKITTGVFAAARLGTGTANNTAFLRGDGVWSNSLNSGTSAITFSNSDAGNGFWVRNDGVNSVISTKTGSIYYGLLGSTALNHYFFAGSPNREVFRVEDGSLTLAADARIKAIKGSGGVFLDMTNNVDANCFFEISASGAGDKKAYVYSGVARLALGGGGAEVASCYSNGNFGIGTGSTAPSEKLHIAGTGKFTGALEVPDDAYHATNWNGSAQVPTKNAIRDKIENLLAQLAEVSEVFDDTGGNAGILQLVDTGDSDTNDNFAVLAVQLNQVIQQLNNFRTA